MGSIIISTKDKECAVDISRLSSFLEIKVSTRISWEDITKRLQIFKVPVDIPLVEIGQEISGKNNLQILELCRFIRQDSTYWVSRY